MATISEAFAMAVEHHQAGRLQAAEQIYRQILAVEPNHANAWHLSGPGSLPAWQPPVATDYICRAIGLDANVSAFHFNLGDVYQALKRWDDASPATAGHWS